MKRSILLGLVVLFLFSCLTANKVVVPRTNLGISLSEAVTIYKSGPVMVHITNPETNETVTFPAVWENGNLIIDFSGRNDEQFATMGGWPNRFIGSDILPPEVADLLFPDNL